jgi:hypothetical protein
MGQLRVVGQCSSASGLLQDKTIPSSPFRYIYTTYIDIRVGMYTTMHNQRCGVRRAFSGVQAHASVITLCLKT